MTILGKKFAEVVPLPKLEIKLPSTFQLIDYQYFVICYCYSISYENKAKKPY
jgi:hypothetical protein